MKKAVGHLVPFMEKERQDALAVSGELSNEKVMPLPALKLQIWINCKFSLLILFAWEQKKN